MDDMKSNMDFMNILVEHEGFSNSRSDK